tara:strand:- start:530 stop:1030 length:501 start_codon:yes stop_codon:yes gene_type:complete
MQGLSKKEIEIVANLEFKKKYYFTKEDIAKYFDSDNKMRFTIFKLRKKERIIKLNRNKYFLIPIKAPKSKWTDNPFIIADEIMDGKDYFIGGWSAANYWKHTDQVPMQVDIWTTRRQGKVKVLNSQFVFHRTTKERIKAMATTRKIKEHSFKIMKSKEAKRWVKGK